MSSMDAQVTEQEANVLTRIRLDVGEEPDPAAAAARRERSWDQLLKDWRSVFREVYGFMSELGADQADGPTNCDLWTQKDLVAHHIMGDRLTLQALAGGDGFEFRTLDDGPQRVRADDFISEFRPVPYDELLEQWKKGFQQLFEFSSDIDGEDRYEQVPWAAVPVSRIALLQARISETWIHGWDSRWPLEATTRFDDRCHWIADLAVRTTIPYGLRKAGIDNVSGTVSLELTGPGGGHWKRRAGDDAERVHHIDGPAWVWLTLATRRWTEHLGWREGIGVGRQELLGLMRTQQDGAAVLASARAFVWPRRSQRGSSEPVTRETCGIGTFT